MDFSVLFVVRTVLKRKKSIFRLFFSAAFGSLYAVIALFMPHIMIVETLITYIIVMEGVVLIAFGKSSINENIKIVLFVYLVTFLLNGIINAFHMNDNMWKVLMVVFVVCGLLIVAMKKVIGIMGEQSVMYIAKITENNKTISVKALKDTGNHLMDPITRKPVSIVEKEIIDKLLSEKSRVLYVPFQSVGEHNGVMKAYIVDQIEVEGKQYNNAVLGLFEGTLSKDNEYNMILHPKLFEAGGK